MYVSQAALQPKSIREHLESRRDEARKYADDLDKKIEMLSDNPEMEQMLDFIIQVGLY